MSFQGKKERVVKRKKQKGKGGQIVTDPVAGTRDFLPPDMRERNWLFGKWRKIANIFGFEEYDAPVLEPEELYKRKAGEEIVEQMYNFEDKSGLGVTLRPEMTPSLARLIMKVGRKLLLPVKWFSIPQCWRYETLCKGRKREHYQWNMDIWGVKEVSCEAEILCTIVFFLKEVGLTQKDVVIRISSRKVLQNILDKFKIPADKFEKTCVIIDKIDKIGEEAVVEMLGDLDIEEETSHEIIKIIKVKSIDELKKIVGEDADSVKELTSLFQLSKGYGISEWLTFDASIVRGLAYYTGIVFEVFSISTKLQRAIAGGGRYDTILKIYGAKENIPACGFGFGDVVIMEVLREKKLVPQLKHEVDDIVIPFNQSFMDKACEVSSILRKAGRKTDIYLKKFRKVKQAYSYADRNGAKRVIFVAPKEWEQGKVRIKYLREGGKQFDVDLKELLSFELPQGEESREEKKK